MNFTSIGNRKRKVSVPVGLRYLFVLIALFAFAPIVMAQAQEFPAGLGCQGNNICDKFYICNGLSCSTDYRNCQDCTTKMGGAQRLTCPGNRPVDAQYVCVKETFTSDASCTPDPNACSQTNINQNNDRTQVVLQFSVFTAKPAGIPMDPTTQTTTAGKKMTYTVKIQNKNPVALRFLLSAKAVIGGPTSAALPGWNVTIQPLVRVDANSEEIVKLDVTSPNGAALGPYQVVVTALSPDIQTIGTGTAIYNIDVRSAPIIDISPESIPSLPNMPVTFTVNITDGDMPGFATSVISIGKILPPGWQGVLSRQSVNLDPGESASVNFTVISPRNATKPIMIGVNATSNGLSSVDYAEVNITLCGDGVCQLNEVCSLDCGTEINFTCPFNGRCEREVDDGVEFSANVNYKFTKFAACRQTSSVSSCESDYDKSSFGLTRNAFCGDANNPDCTLRCVDNSGAYYLYARGLWSAGKTLYNYSFVCPQVNLSEIITDRSDFVNASTFFEQQADIYKGQLSKANETEKKDLLPCMDAINWIVDNIDSHVKYLGEVISSPSKTNTTQARARTAKLKIDIDFMRNQYCYNSAAGYLKMDTFVSPGQTEVKTNATGRLTITNYANQKYYGYSECDYTIGTTKITVRDACLAYDPGQSRTFSPKTEVNLVGSWKIQCRSMGSLSPTCSLPNIHDVASDNFDVYTKDIRITDVTGSCDSLGVQCAVRTSQPLSCVGCKIGKLDCQFVNRNNSVSYFDCGLKPGWSNLTGYVYDSAECDPVAPLNKTISVRCPTCGDGVVDRQLGEECEPPGRDNHPDVVQTAGLQCDTGGNKSAIRDRFGFCSNTCQAVEDPFVFTCKAGICGASCTEGQTRDTKITLANGYCFATEQCGSSCSFNNADCSTPVGDFVGDVTIRSNDIYLNTSISPGDPTTASIVTIMAESNAQLDASKNDNIQIFVDGKARRYCTSSPCVYPSAYNSSVHTYYVLMKYGSLTLRNPVTGENSFGVRTISSPGCTTSIMDKSCYYDDANKIYVVNASATWSGLTTGSHARLSIENNEGGAFYTKNMFRAIQVAGPGAKTIISVVQNAQNSNLCLDQTTVFCTAYTNVTVTTPGTGTGGTGTGGGTGGGTTGINGSITQRPVNESAIVISRNVGDTVKVGDTTMELIIASDSDISSLRFTEFVPKGLAVSAITSDPAVTVAGPFAAVDAGQDYETYVWTTDIGAGDQITIRYNVNIDSDGDYRFASKAEFAGKQKTESKVIFASSCPRVTKATAVKQATGECKAFRTPCDIPQGWVSVPECVTVNASGVSKPVTRPNPPPDEGVDLIIIVPIVGILAIGAALAYKFRDKIRKFIGNPEDKILKKVREAAGGA